MRRAGHRDEPHRGVPVKYCHSEELLMSQFPSRAISKMVSEGWRDGTAVKSTGSSSEGPQFDFQQPEPWWFTAISNSSPLASRALNTNGT